MPKIDPAMARWALYLRDAIHRLNSPGPIDQNQKNETGHTKPSTLGWLAGSIFRIDSVHEIDPKSQSTRRAIIEDCLREPPEPESTLTLASCPLKEITPAIVMMLMDRKVKDGKRVAANNRKNTCQRCSVGRSKIAT